MCDQNHARTVAASRKRIANLKALVADLERDPIGVERRKHLAEWNLHRRTDLARPEEMTDAVCAEIAECSLRHRRESLAAAMVKVATLRPLTQEEEAWLIHDQSQEGQMERKEAHRDARQRMRRDGVGEYEINR